MVESLKWLCLNYPDYSNMAISIDNLKEYMNNTTPMDVIYQYSIMNKVVEGMSNNDIADGTLSGLCPMVVHGLIGEKLKDFPLQT